MILSFIYERLRPHVLYMSIYETFTNDVTCEGFVKATVREREFFPMKDRTVMLV